MKKNCKLSAYLIILTVLSALMPFTLCAEEPDTTERAEAEPEEAEKVPFGDSGLGKSANTWPEGNFALVYSMGRGGHLGPTGLWGAGSGQNIWVSTVVPGSPAHGKVLPRDIIYGVDGKVFPPDRGASYHFANAITKAETKEAGGKMTLNIRRDGKFIQVPIQLKVMGSFSETTPYNCEKSENIVSMAEEYMIRGLRPETGLPRGGYMYGPWNDSVLFLLATGNPKCQGLVRRYIRYMMDLLQASMDGDGKLFDSRIRYSGWGTAYLSMLLGEYYHRTGDPTVLPYYEALVNGTVTRKNPPKMDFSWPPTRTGWGTHPAAQMPATMGLLLADEAGLNINKKQLWYDLKYLYEKRAEYGHVKYMGYGNVPYVRRQADAPLEITEENKIKGTFSPMNGKLGTAAALYSMVNGHEKTVETCAVRCVYAFNNTNRGHGGVWFNGFWTPIGAYHAGPKKFTHFMKGQQWWRELYRDHTGAMWQVGNARGKEHAMSTGYAIHRTLPRKKLRMFGAPRSFFCPDPPPSMKPVLAAHRNRNYDEAEQLTLKLLASGKVPDYAKDRVNHFLDSIQTLKKSIEYDLTFTENLLKKGNFALANVELPQLKMVVSPNSPRLKAIVRALQTAQAKTHISSVRSQAKADAKRPKQITKSSKPQSIEAFNKQLAYVDTLVGDAYKYKGPQFGKRGQTYYPVCTGDQRNTWYMKQVKSLTDAPEGWEQTDFDYSKWRRTGLPHYRKGWKRYTYGLFRTEFVVKDPSVYKTLRIRGTTRGHSNMAVYLNGKLVAMVVPWKQVLFELTPDALKLLKKGKNTMAFSAHRGRKERIFSLRMEGLLKR